MNLGIKKAWAARIGAVAAATLLGAAGAYAAGELAWYTGGNAAVPDPDNAATLTFYNSSGTVITTGSTSAPFADFVASSAELRSGDNFASLYAYTPSSATAQGAWTGSQLSGTTKFAGQDAVAPVGSVPTDKPFVKGATTHQSLAQYVGANPNASTSSALANVYEIRLRTSSASKGVGAAYASAFVKVSGATWTKVAAPPLGTTAVGTTVVPGARTITYGTATNIPVTVTQLSGDVVPVGNVQLFSSSTKLGEVALNSAGIGYIPFSRTALLPGARPLTIKFVPTNSADFTPSQAARTYTVNRRPVTSTLSFTRLPTSRLGGLALTKVAASSGLPVPTGTVTLQYKRSGTTAIKQASGTLASNGTKTIATTVLPKGQYWEFRVKYNGNTRYLPGYSAWRKIRIAS